jgi:hypothetical protein
MAQVKRACAVLDRKDKEFGGLSASSTMKGGHKNVSFRN